MAYAADTALKKRQLINQFPLAANRFHDAEGEPQKVCPSCNMTFPDDFPQHVFEAHVDGHYGPACPMCSEQFVDVDHRQFEAHVQAHFPTW